MLALHALSAVIVSESEHYLLLECFSSAMFDLPCETGFARARVCPASVTCLGTRLQAVPEWLLLCLVHPRGTYTIIFVSTAFMIDFCKHPCFLFLFLLDNS
jgi:hypothetical protein